MVAEWMLLQLLSYGLPVWLALAAIAFIAARFGMLGVIAGHLLVAFSVVVLDLIWMQGEMDRAGWSGAPDQDLVFSIGVVLRILLVNTTLLPVSLLGLLSRTRSQQDAANTIRDNPCRP